MTISVDLQYVSSAEDVAFKEFSTVKIKDDKGSQIVLYIKHKNHAAHAKRIAHEINRTR